MTDKAGGKNAPMTRRSGAACEDPRTMLARNLVGDRAAERRARLFVLACCRGRVGRAQGRGDTGGTRAAERFAAGRLGEDAALEVVRVPGGAARSWIVPLPRHWSGWRSRARAARASGLIITASMPRCARRLDVLACTHFSQRLTNLLIILLGRGLDFPSQAEILRDVMRSPLRSITVRGEWRTCNDPAAVLHIAADIDRDEAFDLLPLLADAAHGRRLRQRQLLAHLQGAGGHAREVLGGWTWCWGGIERKIRGSASGLERL